MAINPESQYPGKIAPSDADYPYGSARNISAPGDGTGTPWEAAIVNDVLGFQQEMLSQANLVPSGSPEKVNASQYLQALRRLFEGARFSTVADATAATVVLSDESRVTIDELACAPFTVKPSSYAPGPGDITLASGQHLSLYLGAEVVDVRWFGAKNDGVTDALSAFDDAVLSGVRSIYCPEGTYSLSGTLNIERSTCVLVGTEGSDTIIQGDHLGDVIVFAPSDPNETGFLNGQGIENILVSSVSTTGVALTVSKAERFNCQNFRWTGISNGILIEGGQFNTFSHLKGQPPTSLVAESAAIRVQAASTSGADQQAFTINISDFFITGGPSKKYDYIFDVANCDGLNIEQGYGAFADTAGMRLDPATADNIAVLQVTNVYLDGVFKSAAGSDYGVLVPVSTGAGSIGATFTGCYIGQYGVDAFRLRSTNVCNIVFNGTALTNSVGRGADVAGSAANSNVKFIGGRISGNTAGGLDASTLLSLSFVGITFNSNFGAGAVDLSGTLARLVHECNTYVNNASDVTDVSTVSVNSFDSHWYKEADYTPVLEFGGASVGLTYSTQSGRYIKIGNMITAYIEIALSAKGSSIGQAVVSLPLSAASPSETKPVTIHGANLGASVNCLQGVVFSGAGGVVLSNITAGAASNLDDTDFSATSVLRITACYEV